MPGGTLFLKLESIEVMKRRIKSKTAVGTITLQFVFLAVAVAQNLSYDKDTLNLFSQYAKSDALDYIAYSHAYREGLTRQNFVFYSTWFSNGRPSVAMQTTMTAKGEVYTVRSVFNWAHQAARSSQLTPADLQLLLATIKEFPKAAQSPPLEFIVVVTFQEDGKWQTRLYDRRKPPPELVRIYKLTHWTIDSN
jgi:hypothetical protein